MNKNISTPRQEYTRFTAHCIKLLLALLALQFVTSAALAGIQVGGPAIVIVKNTVPNDEPQDFSFSGSGGIGDFELDADDEDATLPGSITFDVTAGTYTVSELPVPGFALTDISCVDSTENSEANTETGTATIIVDGTEVVTCTFENSKLGKLIVDKQTLPVGDPTNFDFEVYGGDEETVASFSVADQDLPFEIFLLPESYEVAEMVPTGWELDESSDCDSGHDGERVGNSFDGDSAFISIEAGETVTCTFVNRTTIESNLGFVKAFSPDTIGPGSTTTLTFTITNPDEIPAGLLTFSDDLPTWPGPMTIADFPNPSTTCGGTVAASPGSSSMSFSGGSVPALGSCEVTVDITALAIGVYTNTSNELTSSDGIAVGDGFTLATDDLTVDSDLPGFSKSFWPSTVAIGGRSTLTFTIDNGSNAADVRTALDFTDTLPPGMVVADPANASTDCENTEIPATLTAVPGTSVIAVSARGSTAFPILEAEDTCTVTVDVIGGAVGVLGNVSGELIVDVGTTTDLSAGKASAVLEVTGVESLLELSKEFINDPAAPGTTTTLEFTVTNKSRDSAATAIQFNDVIDPLGGLIGVMPGEALPKSVCGGTLSYGGVISEPNALEFRGGSLPPEGSCTFTVDLLIPSGAASGTYLNETSDFLGEIDGETEVGNTASDLLFVSAFPLLTKEFTDDPVGAGGSVTLEFTITNTDTASGLSAITFLDELTDGSGGFPPDATSGFLPFPVSVTLPPVPDPPCGLGSSLALVSAGTDRQGLELTGGSLAAGDSCTFSLTVDIPVGLEPGTYTNTTEEISAVLDGHAGTPTVVGPPASDDIVVLAAPNLSKEFIDDPVQPGGTVTLEFNLTYAEGTESQATAIAFTDDLSFLLSGITATDIGPSTCNGTIDISTPTMIAYSGGSMSPGEECAFTVTLSVPDSAVSDFYGNTTSEITAMVDGVTVRNNAAEDDLLVTSVLFTKEFLDDPVIAGGEVDLEFRIENLSSTLTASSISFNDSLSAILPGTPDITVMTLPTSLSASCGASASLTGTSTLSFSDGEVAPGEVCSFTVTLMVPTGVADDTYINTTSSLSTGLGSLPPAIDELMVNSTLIGLTKEFTDDPVAPGDTTTLEFTLENLSAETITGIKFSDDLDAALSGLEAAAATNDCGGMATSAFPNGLFEFEGGTLAPGATCTISLTINVPDTPLASGPPYINTTSDVTGKVGALDVFGAAASDELVINTLVLAKEFDAATGPGGTAVLTFTLENLSATDTADNLAFTDDLDAVIAGLEATSLPANPVCGGMLSGSSLITLTGASLAPATVCEFDVTVEVPATASEGQFINTTSELRQDSAPVANPAVALLTIVPPPTFSKVFTPDSIVTIGEISTLVFTIDNTANTVEASDLDFSDILPAGTFVASPANAMTTCTGGTLTAAVGSAVISYSGGSVAAGASCTVEVDIDADTAGMLDNTSGELTSSLGNSGTASDTLTVTSNDADSDTIADAVDNCPDDANTDQADQDGDMIGDVCDPDIDGDMIDNGVDNCPVDANADQADLDLDGTGDVCDDDTDGDGMPNDFETANGLNPFNSFDQLGDPDGDGFTNLEEFEFGSDPNVFDEDLDGNGIPDSVENNNSFIVPTIILPLILDQ